MKRIREQIDPVVKPVIVKFFEILNEEKKNHKTRAQLLDKIRDLVPYMGIPEEYSRYLLELYVLNYRKDGDYSELSKDNFVDPRKGEGKTITNPNSNQYTIAKLPFKGSNLSAYWTKDNNGVPIYVVKSYKWYPVFLFKEDKWYRVTAPYSSSTGRQISNANPIRWDDDVKERVVMATPNEMQDLLRNANYDDLMKKKVEALKKKEPELVAKRMSSAKSEWGMTPRIKVKFKIKKIDIEDDKAVITVDIYDVVKMNWNTEMSTPENYLKGELENIDKDYVEKKVKQNITYNLQDFVGPAAGWSEELRDEHNIRFKFNHLKK